MPTVVPLPAQSKTTCESHGCNRVRVNRKCPQLMCREHCLLKREGYCAVHGLGQALSQGPSHSPQFSTSQQSVPFSRLFQCNVNSPSYSPAPESLPHSPPIQSISTQSMTLPGGDVTKRPKITTQMNAVCMERHRLLVHTLQAW